MKSFKVDFIKSNFGFFNFLSNKVKNFVNQFSILNVVNLELVVSSFSQYD